jgi:hypothetical protein
MSVWGSTISADSRKDIKRSQSLLRCYRPYDDVLRIGERIGGAGRLRIAGRSDGEDIELIAAACGIQVVRIVPCNICDIVAVPGQGGVEKVSSSDPVVKILDLRPDHHDLVRLGIRQRRQERRVIDREDGGVGADAERQGEQNGDGQARVPGKHAEAESEVLKQSLHNRPMLLGT